MTEKRALLMIDLQNDFCKGGSLAIPDGDAVIPLANELQAYFDVVVATQDWHPHDHMSFVSYHPSAKVGDEIIVRQTPQTLWPDHCVQQTKGAEFHPDLHTQRIDRIFYKGIDQSIDSYSAFFDNAHLRSTGLGDYLLNLKIKNIYIMGLATDYCVKFSALDAVQLGFHVYLIEDACRGVELKSGEIANAINEMRHAGVEMTSVKQVRL